CAYAPGSRTTCARTPRPCSTAPRCRSTSAAPRSRPTATSRRPSRARCTSRAAWRSPRPAARGPARWCRCSRSAGNDGGRSRHGGSVRPGPAALDAAFYARPADVVAPELLGKVLLVRDGASEGFRGGRIVEVEAYVGEEDLACHASKGLTRRTSTLFGPPG